MPVQIVKLLDPIQMTITGTFNPMGAYAAGTDYAVGDMVDYQGSSYIMYSNAAAGTVPTNTTYWGLVASKGDTGATGATGPNEVTTATETDLTGILKGDGANVGTAVAGTDYYNPGGTDVAIADGGTGASTAAAAFTALKQAASETATGVVELATDAETITGTDTTRVVTPANIQAKVASDTAKGIVELATTAETTTGTDATRAVTPDGLHDMTSLAGAAWFLDEDNMVSDSATKTASQQSIKAYVDAEVAGASGGTVDSVVAGANIDVDATDPANPIVSVENLVTADITDITASATELNVLDGIPATLTATELGYMDGVTSAVQTQLNGKVNDTGDTMTGELVIVEDSVGITLRPATAEGGTSFEFYKDPSSTDALQRIGQITGHGTGVGSLANEMAWYTTDSLGAIQNRMKFWALTDDTPLILTGATGIARSSAGLIKLGEDVAGGGTSKVRTENDFGVRITPVSRFHVYEDTTGTGSTAGGTIEQDGTGDAVLQFLLTATERWIIGIDNSDGDKFKIADGSALGSGDLMTITPTTGATTFSGDVTVPDEAYGVGWNGSLEVPTKNAVYDKIETLTGGGVSESLAIAYAVAL